MLEIKRLSGNVSSEGNRMGDSFTRPMRGGLENIKRSLKEVYRFVKTALPGALMGAYQATKTLVTEAQQLAKVGTFESRLEKAMEFKKGVIIKGVEAGLTKEERAQAEESILAAAKKTGVDPVEMVNALMEAQSRFAKFKEFIPNLETLGKVSLATDSRLGDLTGMMGTAATIFGLKGQELEDSLYFMVDSAKNGSISIAEFSDQLAKFMGSFKGLAEAKGFTGMREMTGFFQAIQKSMQAEATVVGTYGRAFLADISQLKTQRKLKRAGIEVADKKGKLLPMPEVAERLYAAQESGKLTKKMVANTFKNIRSKGAFYALMQTLEADRSYFQKVTGATAETGKAMVEEQYAGLMGGEMGRLARIGVDAQIKAIDKMEPSIKIERTLAEKVTELQSEFPILAKSLDALSTVAAGAGGTAFLAWLLKGKTVASAAASVTTTAAAIAAASTTTAATTAGAAITTAASAAGASLIAGAGAVGVTIGTIIKKSQIDPELEKMSKRRRDISDLTTDAWSMTSSKKKDWRDVGAAMDLLEEIKKAKKEAEPSRLEKFINLAAGSFGGDWEKIALEAQQRDRMQKEELIKAEKDLLHMIKRLTNEGDGAADSLKKVNKAAAAPALIPGKEQSKTARGVRKPANSVPGAVGVEG